MFLEVEKIPLFPFIWKNLETTILRKKMCCQASFVGFRNIVFEHMLYEKINAH